MATLPNNAKKSQTAARYGWLAFTLLMVAAMCLAMSRVQPELLYVGIALIVLAFIAAAVFIIKYCHCVRICYTADEESGGQQCCISCCGSTLCMGSAEEEPQTVQQIISALRSTNATEPQPETSTTATDIFVVVPPTSQPTPPSVAVTTADKLSHLETEISRLRRQYEFLNRQECVDAVIEQDYATLDAEDAKVKLWKGDVVPTELQLKSMKGRLKRIARNFRLTRLRIYDQDNSAHPNALNGVRCDVNMDAPEQVRIFATDVPIPPAYSENDPEPSATQRHGDLPVYSSPVLSLPQATLGLGMARQNSRVPLLDAAGDTVSMTDSFVPSPSGAYQNSAYIGHLSGSVEFFAPPLDERGAPPAYEEATASPI